jgi:hypothetical protein
MSLKDIFKQALQHGYLEPELQTEVMQICHPDSVLSAEESIYLDRLMGAILTGQIAGLYW